MKPASSTMIALLATKQFVYADCYTITPANGGTPLRYTTADIDIAWAGDSNYPAATFKHGTVGVTSKSKGHWKRGLDVDQWQCTFAPRPVDPLTGAAFPDKIGSVSFLAAVRGGLIRGADFIVDRAYFPLWPNYPVLVAQPVGLVRMFRGQISDITIDRSTAQVTAQDYRKILTNQMPCNLWQAPCVNVLFGPRCGLSAATYIQSGAAISGSTSAVVLTTLTSPVNPSSDWTYVSFARSGFAFNIPVFATDPGSPYNTLFLAEEPLMPDGQGNMVEVLEAGMAFTVLASDGSSHTGTTQSGTQNAQITTTLSPPTQSTGFTLGTLEFTSGMNSGISRTIRQHVNGSPSSLTMMSQFPFTVQTGDAFTILPGCKRSISNCKAYGNFLNFGGTPFIPAPETST